VSDQEHPVVVTGSGITTPRLTLRRWALEDAGPAMAIYGDAEVSRWLAPAMEQVTSVAAMTDQLGRWIAESAECEPPQGRWAVELTGTGELVGGVALLPLPPDGIDLEIGFQLAPAARGKGIAAEAGHALAHYAFESGLDEIFAVARPHNEKGAATARRIGMEWVGTTDKYYDLQLQVYRLRKSELDVPEPTAPQ
jgi:RimJ/RimL family protein N-acetyltransferase